MKLECEVKITRRLHEKAWIERVKVTLEGDYEAISTLLAKTNFNRDMAKELDLE